MNGTLQGVTLMLEKKDLCPKHVLHAGPHLSQQVNLFYPPLTLPAWAYAHPASGGVGCELMQLPFGLSKTTESFQHSR